MSMSDRVVIERHLVLPPIDPLVESFRAEGYDVERSRWRNSGAATSA
jgi:hypothetical protein